MTLTQSDRKPQSMAPLPTSHVRGPLAAVCGLCGGAGASTVAYLLAQWSLRTLAQSGSAAQVLALDAGTATAGLALYSGVSAPRSLAELAEDVHAGAYVGSAFAVAKHGLRVLANAPRPEPVSYDLALRRVLDDARAAHALTVADCGTATTAVQRLVLQNASHVIWVFPASASGVARARVVLDSQPELAATEVVVARREATARTPPTRELASLAALRRASLVLMPSVAMLTARAREKALDDCAVALAGLMTSLRL